MKAINSICRVLTFVFGLGALVLFFTNFATITTNGEALKLAGAQLSFGGKITTEAQGAVSLAKSADVLFCMLLTTLAALTGGFSFKYKGSRVAAMLFSLVSGIYMLVIALSDPYKFVDARPLTDVTAITYGPIVLITAVLLLLAAAAGIIGILVADYIAVLESKGSRKTILKRVVQFLRDYRSEIKKVVWPGPRAVVKNTLVVLAMCLIIGAFIWVLDFGLSQLLNLILSLKK